MTTTPALAAAAAVVDTVPAPRGAKEFRATYSVGLGGAVIGYGATADDARANLLATLEFNLAHNGSIF